MIKFNLYRDIFLFEIHIHLHNAMRLVLVLILIFYLCSPAVSKKKKIMFTCTILVVMQNFGSRNADHNSGVFANVELSLRH